MFKILSLTQALLVKKRGSNLSFRNAHVTFDYALNGFKIYIT